MNRNRLVNRLEEARNQRRKCLMPYVTAGYPDLNTTVGLLERIDRCGCQAIEIGFPFSDSIADGPVIQDSFNKALACGFKVNDLFDAIASVRQSLSAALLAMVSMSIVWRLGVEAFAKRAADVGFDGLIVPDVPVDECDSLARVAAGAGLCNVLMTAPTSSPARLERIATQSTGFVYLIAARGITGERSAIADDLLANVQRVKALAHTPVIAGFGISNADQVRQICAAADGVIVGSAIIRRIGTAVDSGQRNGALIDSVGDYVQELMTGAAAAGS